MPSAIASLPEWLRGWTEDLSSKPTACMAPRYVLLRWYQRKTLSDNKDSQDSENLAMSIIFLIPE